MKRLLAMALCAVLAACNSVGMSTDYKGVDAGYIVAGIGATPDSDFQSYSLIFKNIATGQKGSLIFMQGSIMKESPQYKDEFGVGVVKIASIPSGRYEIINYSSFKGSGMGGMEHFAKEDFSIPFEVKAGKTVYLGNYQAQIPLSEGPLGLKISSWNGFKVRNAPGHDLAIAHGSNGNISAETFVNATPDVKDLNIPGFK